MPTSYDEVPYESYPFAQSHPDSMAVVARIFGLEPPPIAKCRVLELGCAAGGNLIPLAWHFPESEFVGVDLSERQIEEGRRMIQTLGLKNITLRVMSITDAGEELGDFDYIICHGVYSWVPEEVQKAILRACKERLNENGVAYVSYNTYPGWRIRQMIRDMMLYHAAQFSTPQEKVGGARELIHFLNDATAKDNAYGMLLEEELEIIDEADDYYLYHDHMEQVNLPCYFHEFMEKARLQSLEYLGEAAFGEMLFNDFPDQVKEELFKLTSDIVRMEQYMDFLHNRTFRQTLLVHKEAPICRDIAPLFLEQFFLASDAVPEVENASLTNQDPVRFITPRGAWVTSADPLVKMALFVLGQAHPLHLDAKGLYRKTIERLDKPFRPEKERAHLEILGRAFLGFFASGMVEFHTHAPLLAKEAGDRPRATELARAYARAYRFAPGIWHRMAYLDDLGQKTLLLLDGESTLDDVRNALLSMTREGEIILKDEEENPVEGDAARAEIISSFLAHFIPKCLVCGLLQP